MCQYLGKAIQTLNETLKSFQDPSDQIPVQLIEEIYWLILLSGHFMVQPEVLSQETSPLVIPSTILEYSQTCSLQTDVIVNLSKLIFTLVEFENGLIGQDKVLMMIRR